MNAKPQRNDPCPCGSGKKYKKCCGLKEAENVQTRASLFRGLQFPGAPGGYKNLSKSIVKVIQSGANPLLAGMPKAFGQSDGDNPATAAAHIVEDETTLESRPDELLPPPSSSFDDKAPKPLL